MEESKKDKPREKFKIEFEQHQPFEGIADCRFISSGELQKLISELFRAVFADYEGCLFETYHDQRGNLQASMSLLFNHGNYGENDRVACELPKNKKSGQSVIDFQRRHDHQMKNGDRYYLTEDGKDAIESLLVSSKFNYGKIDWKSIVSEWTETNVPMYGMRPTQYTKVSFLDLNNVCRLLFGETDENGDRVDYQVYIMAAVNHPGMMMPNYLPNYMLNITRVSEKRIKNLYEKLGFATSVSQIVR